MKFIVLMSILLLLSGCLSSSSHIQELTYSTIDIPFMGVTGFGKYSRGGRGGRTIYVTNHFDDGPGSLRLALKAKGARIIVFSIQDCIELKSNLIITEGYVTVAGQTNQYSPVCIRNGAIVVKADHVVLQHLSIRYLDKILDKPRLADGLALNRASNVIVSNLSVSWTHDESIQTWYPGTSNITIQNSLFFEPIHNKFFRPDEGHAHGYGPLIGNGSFKVSFINNLVAFAVRRNPRISNSRNINIVGNLFFGFEGIGTQVVDQSNRRRSSNVRIHDNLYLSGSTNNIIVVADSNSDVTVTNNKIFNKTDSMTAAKFIDSFSFRDIGLTQPYRPMVDVALLAQLATAKRHFAECYSFITSPVDANCTRQSLVANISEFDDFRIIVRRNDSDNDGILDCWEAKKGLDQADISDANIADDYGYTNLEYYLSELSLKGFDGVC